jgi:type IV pilus assembly protein PilM
MTLLSWLQTPPPAVTVEIAANRVSAVMVSGRRAGDITVEACAVQPLPDGAVVPSLTAQNIVQPDKVASAIERLWGDLGTRPRRIALAVPDNAAKVSLVRFQQVPARAADLDELVKFQVRKAAPFRIEDSQISYRRGAMHEDGQDFVVLQARRAAIEEYEQVCAGAGATPGVIDLATFGAAHVALASMPATAGDWLLIHAPSHSATLVIFREAQPVFFRHRATGDNGQLGDLVHQTAMYYQDRLGGSGLSRVVLVATEAERFDPSALEAMQAALHVPIERVDVRRAARISDRLRLPAELASSVVPALGLALASRRPS